MSVRSGQFGTVAIGSSELVEVLNWKFSRKVTVHQSNTNTDGGYKKATAGPKSGTVQFSGEVDMDDMPDDHFEEGDSIVFKGYVNATQYYLIPCVVESLDIEVDIDDGKPVSWSCSATTNGQWQFVG